VSRRQSTLPAEVVVTRLGYRDASRGGFAKSSSHLGYRVCHLNPIVRVLFINPTGVRDGMPGRFWVGVLIGLTIVAVIFGLT
jgi:hypothetical protein